MREEPFTLQFEDMAAPTTPDLIIDNGRIKVSQRARHCVHGNGLGWGIYCAACDFELILRARPPSQRSDPPADD
jgi:hypothetical protein